MNGGDETMQTRGYSFRGVGPAMPRGFAFCCVINFVCLISIIQAREWHPPTLPQHIQVDTVQQTTKILEKKTKVPPIHNIATFSDYKNRMVAYRDRKERMCYLERMTAGSLHQKLTLMSERYMKALPPKLERVLYVAPGKLSKTEVWNLAGRRVAEFCRGLTAALLLPGPPNAIVNELPDESGQEMQNEKESTPKFLKDQRPLSRSKRQTNAGTQARQSARKYHGQSQSQFVAFRGAEPGTPGGIAEGTSHVGGAVARVSASNGMGQAQSQSSFDDDCEGCRGTGGRIPSAPEPLAGPGYPGSQFPGQGRPGSGFPIGPDGGRVPGYPRLPGSQYPGGPTQFLPGSGPEGGFPGGQTPGSFPGGQRPGSFPGGQAPGSFPGGQPPGSFPGGQTPGSFPGGQAPGRFPGGQAPGSFPGGQAPGSFPGGQPPGSFPGGQTPGSFPGGQTPGGFPGGQTPGSFPGGQRPGWPGYGHQTPGGPGSQFIPGGPQGPSGYYPGSQYEQGGTRPGGQVPGQGGVPPGLIHQLPWSGSGHTTPG